MTYISRPRDLGALPKTAQFDDALAGSLGKVVKGLGLELLDLDVSRRKRSVQVRLTVYRGVEAVSINDCSTVHRAVLPRLELAFGVESAPSEKTAEKSVEKTAGGKKNEGRGRQKVRAGALKNSGADRPEPEGRGSAPDLYVEVSSPGIDRPIKEGREFAHFAGQFVKCYRTDISDWTGGVLLSSDEEGITLKTGDGETRLAYEVIGKARLDRSSGEAKPAEKTGKPASPRTKKCDASARRQGAR